MAELKPEVQGDASWSPLGLWGRRRPAGPGTHREPGRAAGLSLAAPKWTRETQRPAVSDDRSTAVVPTAAEAAAGSAATVVLTRPRLVDV
jgi:hypothetical protein